MNDLPDDGDDYPNDMDMAAQKSPNRDIGRIGENIVANEFIWRGFLVTHLDKGTRGVSANADLLVMHPNKREYPLLIQVKACFAKAEPNWIFVGNLTDGIIMGKDKMFNRKDGFDADILAAVAISNTKKYRVFIIPVGDAERIIVEGFRKFLKIPKKNGEPKKVFALARISLNLKSKTKKDMALHDTARKLLKYENAFGALTV